MATHGGIFVYDYISAKQNLRQNGLVYLRDSKFSNNGVLVWADVTSDPTGAWFLVFTAFPRDTSPYVTNAVGSSLPNPNDTSMRKLSDDNIRRILNNGQKETRTQWFHTSEAYGTVWADGSLTNDSTMYNLFENPSNWNTVDRSGGQRFKRRNGPNSSYGDWITAAGDGCDGPVGGWSNYQQSSCTISWFAGCEGAPAYYHCCACPVDRESQIFVWAA
jgi:hypothetical protein